MTEYHVVLLVEQPFTAKDATNLRSLHEDIDEDVVLPRPVARRGRLRPGGVGHGFAGHRRGAQHSGGRGR